MKTRMITVYHFGVMEFDLLQVLVVSKAFHKHLFEGRKTLSDNNFTQRNTKIYAVFKLDLLNLTKFM